MTLFCLLITLPDVSLYIIGISTYGMFSMICPWVISNCTLLLPDTIDLKDTEHLDTFQKIQQHRLIKWINFSSVVSAIAVRELEFISN